MNSRTRQRTGTTFRLTAMLLLGLCLRAHPLSATTHVSVEPIPSGVVVGTGVLATIQSAGFLNLEAWSNRLLNDCQVVQKVMNVLAEDGAIGSITPGNTSVVVGAGGFEAVTNPAFVFTIRDSGIDAASAAEIAVLDNALGYVLSQDGTARFSPDDKKAYDFTLDYAVVTFAPPLAPADAKAFFDFLGTIDPALWSGQFAGFTQIAFDGSSTNNSMLFLKPAASKRRLIDGLAAAVEDTSDATYVTRNNNDRPTTAPAGVAFPGNDWMAFPDGDQYLTMLGERSAPALTALAALRAQHLAAVADLVAAIESHTLSTYLTTGFTCPVP